MYPSVTVAIVTARKNSHTSYNRWRQVRADFLSRRFQHKLLNGEFGALLAVALRHDAAHHVDYQLNALAAGVELPDEIVIVDREATTRDFRRPVQEPGLLIPVRRTPPMLSLKELEVHPAAAIVGNNRGTSVSLGCSDKNTAIVLCRTDVLVMLDDCCLPSFGLVAAVREHFSRCKTIVMPLAHRQLYLRAASPYGTVPDPQPWQLEHSDANWSEIVEQLTPANARVRRRVFGVWAMPTALVRDDLNGYNTLLDGFRGGDDAELLERTDRFLTEMHGTYVFDPRTRLYEIEHEMPWQQPSQEMPDWHGFCPGGWRAPGASLRGLALDPAGNDVV